VVAVSFLALLFCAAETFAQQLSLRRYDVSDGVAHSFVGAIHQDRHGYLWFGTREGLSRFDGYRFTNYGVRDGLPHPVVNAIAEDHQGRLWVATNGGGVARLRVDPPAVETFPQGLPATPKFISFKINDVPPNANRVNALLFDAQDRIWCATEVGVYRAKIEPNDQLTFDAVTTHTNSGVAMTALADSRGRLWFTVDDEVIKVIGDRIIKYDRQEFAGKHVLSLVEDRQGRLLVGGGAGIFEFIEPMDAGQRGHWRKSPIKTDHAVNTMIFDADGALWIGTQFGLIKSQAGRQTRFTSAQGLSDDNIWSLGSDRNGNLWIGTQNTGVCKLPEELIVSFTYNSGLPNQYVDDLFSDRTGRVYVSVASGDILEMTQDWEPQLGRIASPLKYRIGFGLQDRRGNWWLQGLDGWWRTPGPEMDLRGRVKFTSGDGLQMANGQKLLGLGQSQTGELWAVISDGNIFRRAATSSLFERLPNVLPAQLISAMVDLITDKSGALWIGQHEAMARLKNGKITLFQPRAGMPEINPRSFFLDSRGWLWIGLRYSGLSVTKDPTAETPQFINYSTEHGLASNAVRSITEDDFGRIYLGTDKGLDQLDPATGRIRHFNAEDGLPGNPIRYCLKDKHGNIWVATTHGLSKFNPRAERAETPPSAIYITRVNIAGENLPLAETGSAQIPTLRLAASKNNLLIEYVTPNFRSKQSLKYQYRLEGADAAWSAPTAERTVNYARLSPGSYRFSVRAVNAGGTMSAQPATLSFTILRPLWQRWWFLLLAALTAGLLVYAAVRYRFEQQLAVERVRTRLATDLHDDIGASLSEVAVLSEVVNRRVVEHLPVAEPLALIGEVSRDMLDAMNDIVWANNPRYDSLKDLTQRLHHFAVELLEARGIEFKLALPDDGADLPLSGELRQHVFLIGKEAVNNLARHSGATRAEIELRIENGWLTLRVADNGRGFAPNESDTGNGLRSMRSRAAEIGGELTITSAPNGGTQLILRASLKARRRYSHLFRWGGWRR
jgi:ligand-binding sensor domain-containing protein/signal transduction histidine kinase